MRDLLIDTVTINSVTESNSGGDVSKSQSALYTGIAGRLTNLNYRDERFKESRAEYVDITKKLFLEADKTAVQEGHYVVHGSDTYKVRAVRINKDSKGVHHVKLYLAIIK